jgi:hypothetical protein
MRAALWLAEHLHGARHLFRGYTARQPQLQA